MKYKFLQLWSYPFYKLQLLSVQVLRKVHLKTYKDNYQIIGQFKFKTPQYVLDYYKQYKKQSVINYLNKYFVDKNFTKKFKKTVSTQSGDQTIKFSYLFNLSPDALVDYKIQGKFFIAKFKGVLLYKK